MSLMIMFPVTLNSCIATTVLAKTLLRSKKKPSYKLMTIYLRKLLTDSHEIRQACIFWSLAKSIRL